jgi:hypothetical protein
MSDIELRELWNFDDTDLGANRLGQLTQKQKDLLAEMAKKQKSFNSIIGIIIAVVFGGTLLTALVTPIFATLVGSFLTSGKLTPEAMLSSLPFLCIGLFSLVFFGGLILVVLKLVFDKANRKMDIVVRRAEGTVNFLWVERQVRRTGNNGPRYRIVRSLEMRVGTDNTFNNVSDRLPSLINQGDEWIIYHTNHPLKLLSGEIISKGK